MKPCTSINASAAVNSGVRRFHDIDKSGWWILIGFIPIIGGLIILYFFVQPSDEDENRFGPVPEPGIAS